MPETKTQKPSFGGWPFVAALVITVFFIGIFLIWQNNEMRELKQEMAVSQKQLQTKVETIENGVKEEVVEVVKEPADPMADWKIMKTQDYMFSYPDDWTVMENDTDRDESSIDFYDEDDNRVGLLRCPIPETGFELMIYEKSNRFYQKNGALYGADMWEGKPELSEYPEYYDEIPDKEIILFMHEDHFGAEEMFDGKSCMLIIRDVDDMVEVAKSIYNSIE